MHRTSHQRGISGQSTFFFQYSRQLKARTSVFSFTPYTCECKQAFCSMAHTDSVSVCLYTQLESTQVNTQLPQGTKTSNQIPRKVHQWLYIWILICQRTSSHGSLLGWQRKSTQWYAKIPFLSLSTNAPFYLVLQDLIFPVTDSTWARKAVHQKQTCAERHPALQWLLQFSL